MWAEHMVSRTSFRRGGDPADRTRFEIDLRLNWSRSIPMSCVAEVGLRLDGDVIDAGTISLTQGGVELPLAGWAERDDIWWPVLDPAIVSASASSTIVDGTHELEVELRVRVPGFAPGPDGVWPTRFNRATVVEELA